ncbi:MepB family protein [Flavobacterium algicola]|uniref:MepB family protein n=1 Tax=Flavobacterium algicola TaxID=556529 RepID=UPI001EFC5790|nr:MepB family protein [Flavobacterium algicola]MCG9792915.1 MepB family protein [Flavobacterium algicola]
MHQELQIIKDLLFKSIGLELSHVVAESESKAYSAHSFELGNFTVKFRTAKITPTKTGQFVTLWKRNVSGITAAYELSDKFDYCLIATREGSNFGVFIFPKTVLHHNKILSDDFRDGKRGFRIYPPWSTITNNQAQKTQLWQSHFFISLPHDNRIDTDKLNKLLQIDL